MKINNSISDLILYNDHQVVVFNKPPAMPMQPDKTGDISLQVLGQMYCKKQLYIVHRMDRPVSGICLMAKNAEAAQHLSKQFKTRTIRKTYLAIVPKGNLEPNGELRHKMSKFVKNNKSYITRADDVTGKEAILNYHVIEKLDKYQVLSVDLQTGRHHQIRVQLGHIGFPVKGDVKYGSRRGNKDRSIHLHAWKMSFQHPTKRNTMHLIGQIPDDSLWNAISNLHKPDLYGEEE